MKFLSRICSPFLCLCLAVVSSHAVTILDDTFADGTRNNQNLPTDSAWFFSSAAAVSASVGTMSVTLPANSFFGITYFGTNSSNPVRLQVGDTLTATIRFTFNNFGAAASSSGLKLGVFNFADSTLSPKWATGDGFSTQSQGTNVQGYAVFQNMSTYFNTASPMDLRKRTTITDKDLLGTQGDWTSLITGPGNTNNFPGFANGGQYSLQLALQRPDATSLIFTVTWQDLANSASLSTSVTDSAASTFNFDGIALRSAGANSAATNIIFNEVRVEVTGSASPATIVSDPQDQAVYVGQSAAFSVNASGTAPLAYQWYSTTNTLLTDATNATLTLTNLQTTNSGGYFVIVTNSLGSDTSIVATLTVTVPVAPTISVQPQSQTNLLGQNVSLNVVAGGSEPLNYQWYLNNALLTNATDDTLTFTSFQATNAGTYKVVVSNFVGSVTSSNAVLLLNTNSLPPVFTTQPASQIVLVGGTASFSAVVVGTAPITFQWSRNGTTISGATLSTLTLTNVQSTNAGNYTVAASNSVGSTNSATAVLTVTTNSAVTSSAYNLVGFAQGTTGGGFITESNSAYVKVYTALDFANAIVSANKTAGSVKVIEIMNDLDLGWNEVGSAVQTLASTPFRAHTTPKLHPRLLVTGVSLIDIKSKSGLTIFSANGATLRHCCLNIKSTANIIVRNLRFDEMWEWDEASKGNYDKNDWDFIDLGNGGTVNNIWIDHCTFTKTYDGIVDIKQGSYGITFSWCKYTGDDGATNANSWVRQQISSLESNKTSYAMYNFLRTKGFSVEDIVTIIQGHDKTHLIGANSLKAENANHTVTFHHDWFNNPWDRLPRLRAGNVHNFNIYVDDTLGLAARRLRDTRAAAMSTADQNTLNNTYSFRPFLNGSISTEGGAVLVEKSVYIGCVTPLRNNQTDPSNPTYTGKILALDTIYQMDSTTVRGNSTDSGNPLGPFQAPVIAFSWNLPGGQLPYSYNMDDPSQLQSIITSPTAGAGAGVLTWAKTNWLLTSYSVTAPVIGTDPQNQTNAIGSSATFTVIASGSLPLHYQWYFNTNTPVANATNSTLTFASVQATNAGIYSVIVTNIAGSDTSLYATLAIAPANHPPVPGAYRVATGQNIPVTIAATKLVAVGSDADGDGMSITAANTPSTNNGTASLASGQVTYTPPANYVGADLFTYILTDSHSASATGSVNVTVVSSNNITLNIVGKPSLANNSFQVSFIGVSNLTYTIDRATNLTGPWQLGFTNITAGANGIFGFTDTNNPPAPMRFYRTRYP